MAIIELGTPRWPVVQRYVEKIAAATPGSYTVVEIPFKLLD